MIRDLDLIIAIRDELEREAYFEDYIAKQTNVDYLKGFRLGIIERRDICPTQKLYYCELIYDRINELTKHL